MVQRLPDDAFFCKPPSTTAKELSCRLIPLLYMRHIWRLLKDTIHSKYESCALNSVPFNNGQEYTYVVWNLGEVSEAAKDLLAKSIFRS